MNGAQASSGAAPESSSHRPGTAPGPFREAGAQSAVERRTASTSAIAASPFAAVRPEPGNGNDASVQRTGSPAHGEGFSTGFAHPPRGVPMQCPVGVLQRGREQADAGMLAVHGMMWACVM